MMKTLIKKMVLYLACFLLCTTGIISQASALTKGILPYPGTHPFAEFGTAKDAYGVDREVILIDNVPVAFKYDNFWSYSAKILHAIQTTGIYPEFDDLGSYDFATGSGGLDVLLYTGAAGQDNLGVGISGTNNFEDPAVNKNAKTFEGTWGAGIQANGPVTVGQVYNYLDEFDGNHIPVFYMDLNQTGNESLMYLSGEVSIISKDGDVVKVWALDTINNSEYNPDAYTLAFGEVSFTGESGTVYTVNHNKGSGKADFIAFAPDMDLSLYGDYFEYYFVVHFKMAGLNNGFEEIFLTGAQSPATLIPEPGTSLLLGLGLLGIASLLRRKIT